MYEGWVWGKSEGMYSLLAVERVFATPVRINSPFGVGRNAADDELVEGL